MARSVVKPVQEEEPAPAPLRKIRSYAAVRMPGGLVSLLSVTIHLDPEDRRTGVVESWEVSQPDVRAITCAKGLRDLYEVQDWE